MRVKLEEKGLLDLRVVGLEEDEHCVIVFSDGMAQMTEERPAIVLERLGWNHPIFHGLYDGGGPAGGACKPVGLGDERVDVTGGGS